MDRPRLLQSIRDKARLSFSLAGGPGGQNVNKVSTKAELRLNLADLDGLSPQEASRLSELLKNRISSEGELIVTSREHRTQGENRDAVLARTVSLILSAATLPRRRVATAPTKASIERRLAGKRRRAAAKTLRSRARNTEEE